MDIMIDLETMSPRSNAAIASIGACAFDAGVIDSPQSIPEERKFYTTVDLGSQKGFNFDGSSIYWWLEQSQDARRAIALPEDPTKRVNIRDALTRFSVWFKSMNGRRSFSYGSTFDLVILQNAFTAVRMRNPIHYRDQLCARTIITMSGIPCPPIEGLVGHRAIDDAIRQTIWMQNALHGLFTGK